MFHETVLRRHFFINRSPIKWDSLETLDRRYLPGFGTNRIAKVYDGQELYFTIGETRKGKGNRLGDTIEAIIREFGLAVIDTPTTSSEPKVYLGFDLAKCSRKKLDLILRRVEKAIAECS